jgi:trimethylamine--corrinoid protein Co-methyltransferase
MMQQTLPADSRLERIHHAGLALLEKTGLQVGSAELLTRCRAHGLKVEGDTVFFSHDQVEKSLTSAPNRYRLLARNPANSLDFEPGRSHVGLGRSAAFILEGDGRRRQATAADYIDYIKLAQQLTEIRLVGNLVTPADIAPQRVNRFMMAAQIRYSDKPCHLLHPSDIAILGAAFEIEVGELAAACQRGEAYGHSTVNTISPLSLSPEQGDLLAAMADHGIAINISPAPAMGSSSPCTVAGTLVVNNAEVLGVLTIAQLLRPGLPVLYGVFPAGTDMRTLAATYGSAEARVLEAGAVAMAGYYGLLSRGNVGLNDAFTCDFQAGAEAMLNFTEALRLRINYLPGCGLLASFAAASKAKLILDAELAACLGRLHRPWTADEEDLALDLISQVGPRGTFLTSPHTFSRCRTELYHPLLFRRSTYEKWREGESLTAGAERRADRLIGEYAVPPMGTAARKRLEQFAEIQTAPSSPGK